MPTRAFAVPPQEWPHRPNGLLNEYNPGKMRQRIVAAVERRPADEKAAVQISDDRLLDLLLVSAAPVSRTRLLERRSEIDAVYASLTSSNVVIITLGMVEAWYDREDGLYLNQMPPPIAGRGMPSRYEFRVLDAEDALPLLGESLGALIDAGVPKILLTVSPVPLNTTFDGKDCFIANTYSKSVLRVCAERLMRRFPEVDYFPSYEIVSSGGLAGV